MMDMVHYHRSNILKKKVFNGKVTQLPSLLLDIYSIITYSELESKIRKATKILGGKVNLGIEIQGFLNENSENNLTLKKSLLKERMYLSFAYDVTSMSSRRQLTKYMLYSENKFMEQNPNLSLLYNNDFYCHTIIIKLLPDNKKKLKIYCNTIT